MNEVFTRFPGESESEARKRLSFLRGEYLKTEEDKTFDERLQSERIARGVVNYDNGK